jgi:hypothetical protein
VLHVSHYDNIDTGGRPPCKETISACLLIKVKVKNNSLPIPVVARSKAWVYGRSLTGIVGSNPAEGMDVICCVLSGRGLCVGLVTRPEESYRVWCV